MDSIELRMEINKGTKLGLRLLEMNHERLLHTDQLNIGLKKNAKKGKALRVALIKV